MNPLSPKRRSALRSDAHKLSPTVIIGDKGLTDEVLKEIDRALTAHELIKVRAATDDRDARNVWMESICAKLEAHPVQQIGKVLVIYRENPVEEKPKRAPRPPRTGERAGDDGKKSPRSPRTRSRAEGDGRRRKQPQGDVKRTSRPRSRTPSPRPASEPRRRRPRTSR